MDYEFITEASRADAVARQIHSECQAIADDTETTGLSPIDDKVILLTLSTPQGKTYVVDTRDVRCLKAFAPLLEDEAVAKIGFNSLFDYCMIKGTAGIEMENNWDLFLGEIALTNGVQFDRRGLADVSKKYIGVERDKSLQKSFIGHKGDFTQGQLQYAAEDTADLFKIGAAMKTQIIKEGLLPTWRTENNAIPAYGDMYVYGQKLDVPAWTELMRFQGEKLKEAKKELDFFFEQVYGVDLFGEVAVNYASQPQVLYGLQMMGIQVDEEMIESTGKEVQKKIMHLPQIMALNKYRGAETAIKNYGQKWIDAVNPKTGRVHLQNNQWGTETGRGSGKGGLNDRNLPRDKRYRQCFTTDDDRMISTVDYSGAELRILAELSGDDLMIKGFNSGVDFHCYVAAMLFNREKVDKKDPIRQPTKTLNFGLAYGMGPKKLYVDLSGEGYKTTLEDCYKLFDKYKQTFRTAVAWLDMQKLTARERLVMVNTSGRRRRWIKPDLSRVRAVTAAELLKQNKGRPLTPEQERIAKDAAAEKYNSAYGGIERAGANYLVQSENVEWTKQSMYEMRKEFKRRKYDARMYKEVYDETVLDCHKNCAVEAHEIQKKIMIECGQRRMKRVPVEVEGHLDRCWTK